MHIQHHCLNCVWDWKWKCIHRRCNEWFDILPCKIPLVSIVSVIILLYTSRHCSTNFQLLLEVFEFDKKHYVISYFFVSLSRPCIKLYTPYLIVFQGNSGRVGIFFCALEIGFDRMSKNFPEHLQYEKCTFWPVKMKGAIGNGRCENYFSAFLKSE